MFNATSPFVLESRRRKKRPTGRLRKTNRRLKKRARKTKRVIARSGAVRRDTPGWMLEALSLAVANNAMFAVLAGAASIKPTTAPYVLGATTVGALHERLSKISAGQTTPGQVSCVLPGGSGNPPYIGTTAPGIGCVLTLGGALNTPVGKSFVDLYDNTTLIQSFTVDAFTTMVQILFLFVKDNKGESEPLLVNAPSVKLRGHTAAGVTFGATPIAPTDSALIAGTVFGVDTVNMRELSDGQRFEPVMRLVSAPNCVVTRDGEVVADFESDADGDDSVYQDEDGSFFAADGEPLSDEDVE